MEIWCVRVCVGGDTVYRSAKAVWRRVVSSVVSLIPCRSAGAVEVERASCGSA